MENKELEIVKIIVDALESKKGEEVRVLEIGKVSIIADFFIIASGANARQVRALMDIAEEALGKRGIHPKRIEGYEGASWVLADYGDIVLHIFDKESRDFYDLEHIWLDAPRVEI